LYEAGAVRNIAVFIRENWRLELNLKGLKARDRTHLRLLTLSLDIIAKCLISRAFGPSGTAFDLSLRRASAMLAG